MFSGLSNFPPGLFQQSQYKEKIYKPTFFSILNMVKRTGTQLKSLKELIIDLKKTDVAIWKRIAKDLEKPTRIRREANLYKIDKFARKDESVVVPGKVLSIGEISKPITIAAFRFSDEAKRKISDKKGKAISIAELLKTNPKGSKVRIIG